MTANYARPPFSPVPKVAPQRLVKQDRAAKVRTKDDEERDKCHARSGGRCEVKEMGPHRATVRCLRRARQNHHLIGGIGRRNKGRSILAAHRLDTCDQCHDDITGKVLVPAVNEQDRELASKVVYERKRLLRAAIKKR